MLVEKAVHEWCLFRPLLTFLGDTLSNKDDAGREQNARELVDEIIGEGPESEEILGEFHDLLEF